ncbi:MAG: Protease PrtS [Candidatus Anoxychlamydiales bacterium]|nr:Protease PrtS [Candidatus Anoxychlamydiales bacterium]
MSSIVVDGTPRTFLSPQIIQHIQKHALQRDSGSFEERNSFIEQRGSTQFFESFSLDPPKKCERMYSFPLTSKATPSPSPIEVFDASTFKLRKYRDRSTIYISDTTASICFDNMVRIDSFCREVFKRHPVANSEKTMISLLHHRLAKNNACWVPHLECVYFGDTDPDTFRPLDTNADVISHEFGHAVIQYAGGLQYRNQSGALNESLADVFAIMTKHYLSKVKANDPNASWLVGEGIVVSDKAKGALRSMEDPGSAYNNPRLGKDPQPKDMSDYRTTSEDHGGVHLYSGIPNRAFCLAAKAEGGASWEKIGKIWFQALEQGKPDMLFSQFALHTLRVAHLEYGDNIANIVGQAWQQVGVNFAKTISLGQLAAFIGGGLGTAFIANTTMVALMDPEKLTSFKLGGIILGGCFGGLALANRLEKRNLRALGMQI